MDLLGDTLRLVAAVGFGAHPVVEKDWGRGPRLSALVGGLPFRLLPATRLMFVA